MATRAELRQRVFNNLYSNDAQSRPAVQRLNGVVANQVTDTVVTVDDGTYINAGDTIEFEDGEQGYVVLVAVNDLTVARAWNGTSAASHADDEFIKINPHWTIDALDNHLDAAANDLSAQGCYEIAAGTDITLVAGTDLYELTETDFYHPIGVLAVFYQETTNSDLVGLPFWNVLDPQSQELTADLGVRLIDWGNNAAGDAVSVTYAKDIAGLIGSLTEALLEEAVVAYTTGQMLLSVEGPRIHDPGRYSDRTVQPGQPIRDGSFYLAQYQRLVWRYKARLRTRERNIPGGKWARARRFKR